MTDWWANGLNQILRDAGLEYPLGLQGVRDLVMQRDGHLAALNEAQDEIRVLRGQITQTSHTVLRPLRMQCPACGTTGAPPERLNDCPNLVHIQVRG